MKKLMALLLCVLVVVCLGTSVMADEGGADGGACGFRKRGGLAAAGG